MDTTNDPLMMIAAPLRERGGDNVSLFLYLDHILSIDYPKDRVIIFFMVNNSSRGLYEIVDHFKKEHEGEYAGFYYKVLNFPDAPPSNCCRIGHSQQTMYQNLAILRNKILEEAKFMDVDYLLSIDSDIIAAPNTLQQLLGHKKDCVAALVKNSPVQEAYNYLLYDYYLDRFYRNYSRPEEGLLKVDLTGACYLLSRKAFEAGEYLALKSGEDEGFCRKLKTSGIEMFVDTNLRLKHIYDPERMELI